MALKIWSNFSNRVFEFVLYWSRDIMQCLQNSPRVLLHPLHVILFVECPHHIYIASGVLKRCEISDLKYFKLLIRSIKLKKMFSSLVFALFSIFKGLNQLLTIAYLPYIWHIADKAFSQAGLSLSTKPGVISERTSRQF